MHFTALHRSHVINNNLRVYGGITRLTYNRSLKLSGGVDIGIDRIGGYAPYLAYQTT
jgi:hypothetical protein